MRCCRYRNDLLNFVVVMFDWFRVVDTICMIAFKVFGDIHMEITCCWFGSKKYLKKQSKYTLLVDFIMIAWLLQLSH